jgi:hypothetical protein
VQKFNVPSDPTEPVSFELMFGGNVNKTKVEEAKPEAERNICPIDPGDICQASAEGAGQGQFGGWAAGSFIAIDPSPSDVVYVGDRERIQKFNTEGHYLGDVLDPDEVLKQGIVQSLAIDPNSDALYLSFAPKAGIFKLDATSGEELTCEPEAHNPTALAVGPQGELYAVKGSILKTPETPREAVRFDSACGGDELLFGKEFSFTVGENQFSANPTGIATSTACGLTGVDLFFTNPNGSDSFAGLYGPPPDPDICPPPPEPPLITDQFATSVAGSSATVGAEINPRFWPDAIYFVQYGTGECSAGGCEETAPVALTEDVLSAPVATKDVFLAGLAPATTYHYRFVAQSSGGGPVLGVGGGTETGPGEFQLIGEESTFTTFGSPLPPMGDCPNQVFRGGLAASLPDCRAYELVSPLDKENGDIDTSEPLQLAAPDGNRATYSSLRSFGDPQSAPLLSQYLASRDPAAGWRTHSISPPRNSIAFYPPGASANKVQFKAFSEDLCESWLLQDNEVALAPSPPSGVANVYRRVDRDCSTEGYDLLTPVAPPGFDFKDEFPASTYIPTTQGRSADGSRTLLRIDAELTADACKEIDAGGSAKGIFQLYLHSPGPEPGGELHLVSILPSGEAACVHASAGTAQGLLGVADEDSVLNAISADGSRVFWSTDAGPKKEIASFEGQDQPGPLYVRLNPEGEPSASGECYDAAAGQACTIQISAAANALFRGADSSGETAIYTASGGLYEFDVASEASTPIATEGVAGLMGMSADMGRVYFVSTNVLPGAGPNGLGDEAVAGEPNLYLHEHGAGESFVATLSDLDANQAGTSNAPPIPTSTRPDRRTARVSADGLHAAFTSDAPLTDYDNADAVSGEPDAEVYLYDAVPGGGVGELRCVSCNPGRARPRGRKVWDSGSTQPGRWVAAQIPGWPYQLQSSRALVEGGGRLFFESTDALVPRDTNGKQDVYEWERAGSPEQCQGLGAETYVPSADGCLSLISAGKGVDDSQFVDASASGDDVFFTTGTGLLPEDFGLVDVYDARVNGGFPPPVEPAPPCEGEACQPYPDPPQTKTPGSSSFDGPGNLPADCAGPARRAKGLAKRAKALRQAARDSGADAAQKRRQAARLARKAKSLQASARRCRAQGKRASGGTL